MQNKCFPTCTLFELGINNIRREEEVYYSIYAVEKPLLVPLVTLLSVIVSCCCDLFSEENTSYLKQLLM